MGFNGSLIKRDIIDAVALIAIGTYIAGCVLGGSNFSERHITLSFLNFPIFLGELLILFCAVLVGIKAKLALIVWEKWHALLGLFLGIIMVLAIKDYLYLGPLSFRNAAMYYYVIFLVFGHIFYNKKILTYLSMGAILPLMFMVSRFHDANYFFLSCFILLLIIILRINSSLLKWGLLIVLALVCNYSLLFGGSRTNMISSIVVIFALIFIYVRHFLVVEERVKKILLMSMIGLLIGGVLIGGDRNGLKSLCELGTIADIYKENNELIKNTAYSPEVLKASLFNSNDMSQSNAGSIPVVSDSTAPIDQGLLKPNKINVNEEKHLEQTDRVKSSRQHVKSVDKNVVTVNNLQDIKSTNLNQENFVEKLFDYRPARSLTHAQYNIVFRIYIWEDMFRELMTKKAFFGLGFGHAQRSASLEKLGWGQEEWRRDGWITPHNAVFHVIYRLGLWGLILLGVLCYTIHYLYRRCIELRNFQGILLLVILVYWLVASNFLVILELPHYAILFWMVFGLTIALLFNDGERTFT